MRWFLSYHSPDQALAERVKDAIERRDSASTVFFAPAKNRAGGFWTVQLAQELADATAFILVVGERGVGPWQLPEYFEALDRRVREPDFPVVLMLLAGQTAPGLPFLRQLHWIVTPDPASEKDVARLFDAAAGPAAQPGELWRYTTPYRGLVAMEEKDSDYFFGRVPETIATLKALAAEPDKLPLLLGNSGVGKSSVAQAGVLAALRRQAWPATAAQAGDWPTVFRDSRRWCFLKFKPGNEPLRELVRSFLDTWQFGSTDPERVKQQNGWIELLREGKENLLRDLLDATERRFAELAQPKPSAFFLYIDQGEELYVRAGERDRCRFSRLLAQGLADPRLHALVSMRTDFFGDLQKDEQLYQTHRLVSIPPLREAQLLEVVSLPAALLAARFETDSLAAMIARRTAEESTREAGALPLLSYLLDDMWTGMVQRSDGVLRLPEQAFELGGVLVERANAFMSRHPGSEDKLRRIFTLKLATVREDGAPTRRRARRSEFSDEEWRLVTELADHPYRLLVTGTTEAGAASVLPSSDDAGARAALAAGQIYAEVAHEAIFGRWGLLSKWIDAERALLAWRTGLEADRRAWEAAPKRSKLDALLMGFALEEAQSWLAMRQKDIPEADREFIMLSRKTMRRRTWRARSTVGGLVAALVAGVAASWYQQPLKEVVYWITDVRGHVLTAEQERALKPMDAFRECTDCPEMVVVPAQEFLMGTLDSVTANKNEKPQHTVAIAKPFAVAKFVLTFEQWDACVVHGNCDPNIDDGRWGHGQQPVINVSWYDAKRYVAWLSRVIGKPYRLLTEAEWEYAARAGTTTAFYWGDDIGNGNANCIGCGSEWDGRQPSPAGSFKPNMFGLYDMAGNVWQWVEDCYHENYVNAPGDGSAWTSGDCSRHVLRGGSWTSKFPKHLHTAFRSEDATGYRTHDVGFRVAVTR